MHAISAAHMIPAFGPTPDTVFINRWSFQANSRLRCQFSVCQCVSFSPIKLEASGGVLHGHAFPCQHACLSPLAGLSAPQILPAAMSRPAEVIMQTQVRQAILMVPRIVPPLVVAVVAAFQVQ